MSHVHRQSTGRRPNLKGTALLAICMGLTVTPGHAADRTDTTGPIGSTGSTGSIGITRSIDVSSPRLGLTTLDLTYEFYGGGLHVVTLDTQAVITPSRYEIASQIETTGIADTLFKGRLHSSARGMLTATGPRLDSYSQDYNGRFGERSVYMSLTSGGLYDVETKPSAAEDKRTNIPPGALRGTVDPLTASIYTALNQGDDPCRQSIPVFDGRRVFKLDFAYDSQEELTPQAPGVYAGNATKCKVTYRSIAGHTRKWALAEAKDPTPPFTVWIAEFEGLVGDRTDKTEHFTLPVRLLVETRYISAVAHLTQAVIDGQQLIRTAAAN